MRAQASRQRQRPMSMRSALLHAAAAGILAGASLRCAPGPVGVVVAPVATEGAAHAAPQPAATAPPQARTSVEPAPKPTFDPTNDEDTAAAPAAHACKGRNDCKGLGGCKTSRHACKGQNDCKGQGGCKG